MLNTTTHRICDAEADDIEFFAHAEELRPYRDDEPQDRPLGWIDLFLSSLVVAIILLAVFYPEFKR